MKEMQPSYYRLAEIHKTLDPPGTSLRSVEELVGELQERNIEADRLLRAAYADAHSEDVPLDVLRWLNPDTIGES